MKSIVFYFHAHQPRRIKYFSFFNIGLSKDYFNDELNKRILDRVVAKSYIPALKMFLDAVHKYDFKFSFSITGTLIEQLELWHPEVIDLWKELVDTGNVEIVSEPYYHSLSIFIDEKEFREQVRIHLKKIKEIFGIRPKSFRNFELSYSNDIGRIVDDMGFKVALAEGTEKILGWRSPNYVYRAKNLKLRLMLRNYRLSDDIAFRFANPYWEEYPLTAEKFYSWLKASPGETINLFMDFETIGEHIWPEAGIFDFYNKLFELIGNDEELVPMTIFESAMNHEPKDEIDVPYIISWADLERDLSAWLGDEIQQEAFRYLKEIYEKISSLPENIREEALKLWRYLSTSDHLYYMSLKYNSDGDIHNYFREEAFYSPYDAFISFLNILRDIELSFKDLLENPANLSNRTLPR